MALNDQEKLPNLKICIDNADSESDDDNLSLTDEPQLSIEEELTDKRVAVSVTTEDLAPESPLEVGEIEHVEEDDVQFNVYLDKVDSTLLKPVDKPFDPPPRRYENKEGNFFTGIDLTEKEQVERRQERAKRFGLEYMHEQSVDLEALYKSLGLKAEDLDRRDERGMRLEAIHFRGVKQMNTKDVFSYFQDFAAGGCEWIDDDSCNVVWMDKVTAARAMVKLSRSYEQVMESLGMKPVVKKTQDIKKKTDKMDTELDKKTEENGEVTEESTNQERNEEKMEEEDDNLDLMEDNKPEEVHVTMDSDESKTKEEPEKMEDEGIEEGEITDSDSDTEPSTFQNEDLNQIPWPPGKWRLGVPFQNKSKYLFLRFATKADVKIRGAEKRSKFYQKYGNPNYGGMVGLISTSLKRKMRNYREKEDELETFGISDSSLTKVGNRNQVSYGDDLFSDTITPVEIEEIDMYSKTDRFGSALKINRNQQPNEDEEEMDDESSDENDFPVIEKVVPEDEEVGDSSDVDELELQRLLGKPDKKPARRMYADDVEEEQKAQRHRQLVGALTIVADAKKKVKRVKDARELISGVDLRQALKEKKMNRQEALSPVGRMAHSRSSSRSLSPVFERQKPVKKMSPIHMTFENSPIRRSPVDDRSPSPVEEDEEEVVKEVPPHKSPIEFRSRMHGSESPKDVRSRLSKSVTSNMQSRLNQRSPNNVKSRLSKRISPENRSPERTEDQRQTRIRKSRSPIDFRSRMRKSPSPVQRRPRMRRSRSPINRRFNIRSKSPIDRRLNRRPRSPFSRRFNRSRSRSPVNRRLNRSRSPLNRRMNPRMDRTRPGRDARSRLGRKSRSPTDTESDSDEAEVEPSRIKMTVAASSDSSSSSSSSQSSSDSSSSDSSSSSSSSSSSANSSSSSSDSDSDASERSAIRNKKSQRKQTNVKNKNVEQASARERNGERAAVRDKTGERATGRDKNSAHAARVRNKNNERVGSRDKNNERPTGRDKNSERVGSRDKNNERPTGRDKNSEGVRSESKKQRQGSSKQSKSDSNKKYQSMKIQVYDD